MQIDSEAAVEKRSVRYWAAVIALVVILAELLPLTIGKPFYIDWVNHVWVSNYYAEYLVHHGYFPITIDAKQNFGNTSPIFYSVFFYPISALFALAFGADVGMRIFCALLLVAPLVAYLALFLRLTSSLTLAALLATAVNSSVYQLTNLYTRGALTEFAAHQTLLVSFALIGLSTIRAPERDWTLLIFGVALFATALGMHPITFYLLFTVNLPILLLIGGLTLHRFGIRFVAPFIGLLSLSGLLLLPWIWNTARYSPLLDIASNPASKNLFYLPHSVDSFWGLFGLMYVDARVFVQGIGAVSTPFLESPLPLALTLASAAAVISLRRRNVRIASALGVVLGVTALTLVYLRIAPSSAAHWVIPGIPTPDVMYVSGEHDLLHKVFRKIQFAYRLSNAYAICLTLGLTSALFLARSRGQNENRLLALTNVALIAGIVGATVVCTKTVETYVEFVKYPKIRSLYDFPHQESDYILSMDRKSYTEIVNNVDDFPITFYGLHGYAMLGQRARWDQFDLNDRETHNVDFSDWGKTETVTCAKKCFITTNISPTEFSRLTIDGHAPAERVYSPNVTDAALADAGTHELQVTRVGTLIRLIQLSVWGMFIWLGGSGAALVARYLRSVLRRTAVRNP